MAYARRPSADRLVKVVLVGSPGAGKAAILKAVAGEYAHRSVRAGELSDARVFRTEFYWPEALPDGRRMRVNLYAASGRPSYNALNELLVSGADGLVFVANLAREEEGAVREAFQTLLFNARHRGLDVTALPFALHCHLSTPSQEFAPDEMNALLGVPVGAVKRFVTGRGDHERLRVGVEWVVAELAKAGKAAAAPARQKRRRAGAA